ncbi:MAG: hypothetical protein V7603_1714, partial [Micromonosporaceae bacterium]
QVAGAAARPADRLDTRLLWRLAATEVAAASGNAAAARRHLTAGLATLRRYRELLGTLDLQTGAAVYGRDLVRHGLRRAIAAGRLAEVFRWAELARAQALLMPAVRPPADPAAAAALEELRGVRAALDSAELAGRPTRALRTRVEDLQRALREHAWSAPGRDGAGRAARPAGLAEVHADLGAAAMVVYLRDGPVLRALVVAGGRSRLVRLCPVAHAEEYLRRLRADLDAQAGRALPDRLALAVHAAARRDGAALAAAILDPLLGFAGDRDLVVVPTGALLTVPWPALPGCAGRTVTVAPSATTWRAARARLRRATPVTRTLLVAGPRNDRGVPEVQAIAGLRGGATVLVGPDATPAATLAALPAADLAHLAAHGRHQTDNALFSGLDLAGGPLMGYDLQQLPGAPAMVVLSACDLGLHDVRPGDESLGMASALLAAGSGTVVASVCRIADTTAMTVMTGYHRMLVAGRPPAAALAAAAPPDLLSSFVCFGAG